MKCPGCLAVIDESYVESFGGASSVSCPACGSLLQTGDHDLFSTATEFKPVAGWTIRLAKGQEIHFASESDFSLWLKQTTVTPGDMICKDGANWESLGTYLLSRRGIGASLEDEGYSVPPNTLDAPDPEDEFEELDRAVDTIQGNDASIDDLGESTDDILNTAVGHEKRTPPPIPANGPPTLPPASSPTQKDNAGDDTVSIEPITEEETVPQTNLETGQERLSNPSGMSPEIATDALSQSAPLGLSQPFPPTKEENTTAENEKSNSTPEAASVSAAPVISPASENRGSPNVSQVTTPGPATGGGIGKVIFGLVIGAVLGGGAIKLTMPKTVQSSAQRVVVTKTEETIGLKEREILESSKAWLPYFSLKGSSLVQLDSRLKEARPSTESGQTHREALALAAYVIDMARTKDTATRTSLASRYREHFDQSTASFSASATNALDAWLKQEAFVAKQTVAEAETNSKSLNMEQPAGTKAEPSSKDDDQAQKTKSAQSTPAEKGAPAKEKAPSLPSDNYERLMKEGTRNLENGRLEAADAALTKAAALKPKAHAPLFKLGYVALNRKNLDKALSYFKKALEIKPRDRETLLGLGSVYEKLGLKSDARKVYQRYQSYFTGDNDRRRIEYKLEKLGK